MSESIPTARYPIFYVVCRMIVNEIILARHTGPEKSKRVLTISQGRKLRASVAKLVRDSVAISLGRGRQGVASINKRSNAYSHGQLGPDFTYKIFVTLAYESMVALGYLFETQAGVSDGSQGKYLTRYIATDKLISMFGSVDPRDLPAFIPPEPPKNLIRVRLNQVVSDPRGGRPRKLKVPRLPPDTPERWLMEANLKYINALLHDTWVDLEVTDLEWGELHHELAGRSNRDPYVDLTRRTLFRVFNDVDLSTGGRFFGGWWQQIPSRYRSRLLINNKRTTEYDFRAMHPTILYAQRGLPLPSDPYEGVVPAASTAPEDQDAARSVAKKAFNAIINARAPMQRQPTGMKLSEFGVDWQTVSNRILDRHDAIRDAFYSGVGGRLQFEDAQIAEELMISFTEIDAPLLPVHDSFVSQLGYDLYLEQEMRRVFRNRYQVVPELKLERKLPRPQQRWGEDLATMSDERILAEMPGYERRYGWHELSKQNCR